MVLLVFFLIFLSIFNPGSSVIVLPSLPLLTPHPTGIISFYDALRYLKKICSALAQIPGILQYTREKVRKEF